MKTGRRKEAEKIVELDRAVEVANLMLGKLNRRMKRIYLDDYLDMPRRNLKAGKTDAGKRTTEVNKFARENFKGATTRKLATLYEPIFERDSKFRLPFTEFVKRVGEPCGETLRAAPLHSTICISPWGLQTEFPEMHLSNDLTIAYNCLVDRCDQLDEIGSQELSWSDAKSEKGRIAGLLSEKKYHMRMSLICCFNLLEAYINGIAWEFNQRNDVNVLSNNKRKMIEGDQTSFLDKLIKIPKIVADSDEGPLRLDKPPLSEFKAIIKPFRDSIVHASPFSAPERYGGYDKLSKIYDIELETVKKAVDLSFEIIGIIHRFIGGEDRYPSWLPIREADGRFVPIPKVVESTQ